MRDRSKERNEQILATAKVVAVAALVLFVWWQWPFIITELFQQFAKRTAKIEELGQYGDMFGAFSALMASLAFVAAGAGVILQGKTLAKQREQSEDQREQINRQSFEATLFELLRLHRENTLQFTASSAVGGAPLVLSGGEAFKQLGGDLVQMSVRIKGTPVDEQDPSGIRTAYVSYVYEPNREPLDLYFSNLYHLFKFIEQGAPEANRDDYASLARAQLSTSELMLLSANVLLEGHEPLAILVVRFALLKKLRAPAANREFVDAVRALYEQRGWRAAFRESLKDWRGGSGRRSQHPD